MKKFYIVDKNGPFMSEDGKTHFICLMGNELYSYLRSPAREGKTFYTFFDENDDEIGIEIHESIKLAHIQEKNHSDYLKIHEKASGYTMVSMNADCVGKDGEVMTYEEIIADDDITDLCDEIIREAEFITLKKALDSLDTDEYEIINRLYLCDNPISERKYAVELGIPQKTLNNRKLAILKKLQNYL